MSTYAWIVDYSHLDDAIDGTTGPRDAPAGALAALGNPVWPNHYGRLPVNVRRFRLLDDDGILYFSGRQYIDPDDASDLAEFGPLDDYGRPGFGAVDLQVRQGGQWVSL